jgi:archaellum component FlaC/DNA-binding transcriptional ArsR family regulator
MFCGGTMASFEEETYSTVFTSLRHPIRRKILRSLSAGPQSFSDLQRTLGIESSHLTYHLEGLTSLLEKSEKGEYMLSSLGRIAVSTMKQVEEPPKTPLRTEFLPRFWRHERARVLALGIICIILGGGLIGVLAYHASTMNDKDSTISLLNSQVIALRGQIVLANSTINSLKSQTAELENQLGSNNSMITALQNQILLANSTINSLKFQTAELEYELASNNSTVAADNDTIANLQTQITTLQNQVNSLQSQINELSNNYNASHNYSVSPGGSGSPPPTPGAPVYFSVEPVAVDPLINLNASINGLEVSASPSAVGQRFTVDIHLRNATATNAPTGVAGVFVDFDFVNILNYCEPIGFKTMLGQSGGALENVLCALNGFYDVKGNRVPTANYTQATQYDVVAAASKANASWNSDDGLVAQITFQITGQPSKALNQSDFYGQLHITFAELMDSNVRDIPYDVVQGTLKIDDATTVP